MATQSDSRGMMHYRSNQTILLVGDGDFSFSTCLAKAFGDATNMVATSLDSHDEVVQKYADAKKNLDVLRDKGCTILHKVDAHEMSKHHDLRYRRFDRIVFNFPHAGQIWKYYLEHNPIQIELHQKLVLGFFYSAVKLLAKNGEVHVTHKTAHPFDRWDIEGLAEEAGLWLIDEKDFNLSDYPGFSNKKGEGHGLDRCDQSFPVGACSTFMFGKEWSLANVSAG